MWQMRRAPASAAAGAAGRCATRRCAIPGGGTPGCGPSRRAQRRGPAARARGRASSRAARADARRPSGMRRRVGERGHGNEARCGGTLTCDTIEMHMRSSSRRTALLTLSPSFLIGTSCDGMRKMSANRTGSTRTFAPISSSPEYPTARVPRSECVGDEGGEVAFSAAAATFLALGDREMGFAPPPEMICTLAACSACEY